MKVLFIYPNLYAQVGFNYGLAHISSMLKEHGHETRLININEKLPSVPSNEEIADTVKNYAPDVIGFSVVTNQYPYAHNLAHFLKKQFPSIPLICGGIHATMVPEKILADGAFDYVCVGEGEQALLELVESLEKNEDTTSIANIWTRRDGRIIKNKVQPFVALEDLPPKDYGLFDFQRMIDAKDGWVGLMASRGCPFRCSYCFNHKIVEIYSKQTGLRGKSLNYIRFHPVKDIIAEIKHLLAIYKNIRMFIFDDDLFTFDKEYLKQFCKAYKEVSTVPFVCNAHVKYFDAETAGLLKEAGCKIVKFGLESGSPRIRKRVLKRNMTNTDIEQAFQTARRADLHTSAFVMFGLPYETKDDMMQTIRLLGRIQPGRFRWALFFPYEGTEAYEMSVEGNFIDFEKMRTLPNFTDESCLDLGKEVNLFVEKIQKALPWFVNAYAGFEASPFYKKVVDEIEALPRNQWDELKNSVKDIDRSLSQIHNLAKKEHYSIRYNDFMAVNSQWKE